MQDIEIYLREPAIRKVLGWLKGRLGPLQEQSAEGRVRRYLAAEYSPNIPIIIQQQVDQGPYTALWLNSSKTPWHSDLEFAREAFENLKVRVYCDPGPEHPGQDDFLRIDERGERVVTLPEGKLLD